MGTLSDIIDSALREHNIPQVGGAGTAGLLEALQRLFAPRTAANNTTDATLEPDALQQLFHRFEQSGYGDIKRSWIAPGQNRSIEPNQIGAALGRTKWRKWPLKVDCRTRPLSSN